MRTYPVTNAGVEFHTGFDTSGPEGTPVYATGSGTVKGIMYWDPGYGNAVIVEHENGFHSLFAHMSSVQVTQGKVINRGDLIGYMGHTGRVTGSHLHYEVWMGYGVRVDPAPFICGTDLTTATCRSFNSGEQ
ncbi:MAG: M23 family metallopeptidase [Spirochaetia bacterium]|nr:M23 family metallopeptidase [Spirochaetia bacterium]